MEVARLRENLEAERTTTATLRITLGKERNEKDSAFLRNAEISQEIDLMRRKNQQYEIENYDLRNVLENFEKIVNCKNDELERSNVQSEEFERRIKELEKSEFNKEKMEGNEKRLKSNLLDLEEQLNEKTKVNKINIILHFYISTIFLLFIFRQSEFFNSVCQT